MAVGEKMGDGENNNQDALKTGDDFRWLEKEW